MDAAPIIARVARALERNRLEVVLIGNAAALHGSPVTTVDLDFMFRKTPRNLQKLKALADELGATIFRPHYPASELYRLVRDLDGLQLDFMAKVDAVSRFEDLRARAVEMNVGGSPLLVAALADVMSVVPPVGTPRGASAHVAPARRFVSSRKPAARKKRRHPSALRRESDRALVEQIRRLLALPMNQRTHFLRKRRGLVGSSI